MKVFNDEKERMTVQPNWKKFELKGKVKSIRTKIYDAHILEGKVIKGFRNKDNLLIFNTKGNLVKNRDEKGEETQVYQYDENECLVRCDYLNDENECFSYEIYQYDDQGNRVKYEFFLSTNSVEDSCEAEYDENNLLLKYADQDGMGKVFEYNEKQQIVKMKKIGRWRDNLFYQYKYDDLGKLVEMQECSEMISKYEGTYFYKSTFYYYDETGKIVKEHNLYYENGEYRQPKYYKYNKNGDEIEKVEFVSYQPWIKQAEYEYDKEGNWIKKIIYDKENIDELILREIEYYE